MKSSVISIVGKVLAIVGKPVFQEIYLIWGYRSQLDDLEHTLNTIKGVLLDAESKDDLSEVTKVYVKQLSRAVYDADDLFDKFHTVAELKKVGNLSETVCYFFSSMNSLFFAYCMSRKVRKMRNKLDNIANNRNQFGLSVHSQPNRRRREETSSQFPDEVVGRESDVNMVVSKLLDSSHEERVSFLSIVGIGGMGKTTLAQLVFNDDRVKSEFPLRVWTYACDENATDFVKKICTNILKSVDSSNHDALSLEVLQSKLRVLLGGKKFLLVLDDLWNENQNNWDVLKRLLMVGGTGSRVLVTTRSGMAANIVSDKNKYELKGLSPEESWRLFKIKAFGNESENTHNTNNSELVKLGENIVKMCSNVPLAIRVVGTLLRGENESKWRSVLEQGLARLKNKGENEIMSILKLSHDDLESPLKACFSYCALFPKDYKIEKDKLIRLWMAQGYIVPDGPGQTLEDVADGYFKNLVQRCFFQNVDMNIGGVELFRIHGLIHELAKNVAGQDVATLHSVTSTFGDDVHHVFHLGSRSNGTIFQKCKIRSYISDGFESDFPLVQLLKNWKFLRTLDLHDLNIQILPNSIGKLLHLRFLDLSYNSRLLRLPDSITGLRNLQTLDLHGCYVLEELPKDLEKLVNLRHLDISRCQALIQMPSGLDKLTCLCVLTEFVVGEENSGRLESLQAFTNLRGSLLIRTTKNFNTANQDSRYLNGMLYLEKLTVRLKSHENHESLLKTLEPPSSLKSLEMFGYDHTTLPTNWSGQQFSLANLLPNLLRIELKDCSNLVRLPSLSELRSLKSLSLVSLRKLEYIQDTTHRTNYSNFFYSLEYLKISYMEDLKGWWNRDNVNLIDSQSSFVKLSELVITHCVNLASLPKCVTLETLKLVGVPKEFQMSAGNELQKVETDNVYYLQSLRGQTPSLTTLSINGNVEVTSFSELGDTFFNGCPSLRSLEIMSCSRLTSLNGEWWNHLTALESLQLRLTPQLILTDDDGIPWHLFETRLRTLQFTGLAITNLPTGMQNLTFLQKLELESCENLECLPEWISRLSSLRSLSISDCETFELIPSKVRGLTSLEFLQVLDCPLVPETFTDRNGNEWDNLRHITVLDIRSNL